MEQENNNAILSFEDLKNQNGIVYRRASEVTVMPGYNDMKAFCKVPDRATKAFVSPDIPHYENIMAVKRNNNGVGFRDFRLTRFACCPAAMNGDPKKPEAALAQAYFARQTRKFELYIENDQETDRVPIREGLADGNKSPASTAKAANVTDYARFQNAGYPGMYNMESWKPEKKRGVKKGKLSDGMSRTGLAASPFRVTRTEGLIKSRQISGQADSEQTHYTVGRQVRNMAGQNTGRKPERLPQEKELPVIKKALEMTAKEMKKTDKQFFRTVVLSCSPKVRKKITPIHLHR